MSSVPLAASARVTGAPALIIILLSDSWGLYERTDTTEVWFRIAP